MSNMLIEIVAAPISTLPTKSGKGTYQVIELAYKNKSFQDKLEGKKVMSFTNKEVFATLSTAKFGDVFNVTRVKNDAGFWDWTALSTGDSGGSEAPSASTSTAISGYSAPVKAGTVTPKSTYETPEERALRREFEKEKQVLIVRQSSLSNAMDYAVANKIKDETEILALAQRFHDWVFNKATTYAEEAVETAASSSFADFTDDIPY